MLSATRRIRSLCISAQLAFRSFSGTFKDTHHWTPPVNFLQGSSAPTALQWLRRRGPKLPNGVLQQLFRNRRVKVFLPGTGKVQRASKELLLPHGACILIPRDVADSSSSLQTESLHVFKGKQLEGIGDDLRNRVLYIDDELLVINKPPGLAVQGGSGISIALDTLAAQELQFGSKHVPRLAHRLDREVSGALVLGRTPDSTAWLSAAFRQAAQNQQLAGRPAETQVAWVRKRYWAVVEAQHDLPDSGTINEPVSGKGPDGVAAIRPALTNFRIRARAEGLAWLELEPQTGRKHQLRLHCAESLGSPIKGDTKYGAARPKAVQLLQSDCDTSPLLRSLRPSLYLHCRSLQFKRPGRKAWEVTAPLPPHIKGELMSHGWIGSDEC